jgi:23S rRNA (adenine2503-C2)-methyltransferase
MISSIKKPVLLGMTLEEISTLINEINLPKYTAREIALWIYRRGATSFDEMTNISKSTRNLFKDKFTLGGFPPEKVEVSSDGTKKYLFPAQTTRYIETAYIPEKKRHTLCVSSQVGCKLGCLFCMTARQGFQGNLTSGEIINQVVSLPEREKISNIVFMGMGEPFDNTDSLLKALEILTADYGLAISPRKITVSTVGLIPGMKKFIEESRCQLAISLHSPFDDERSTLMPIETIYPIRQVIKEIKSYAFEKQRRLSFEYILFSGLNDSSKHINELARLLNGLRCRINLMRYHPLPGTPLKGTNDISLKEFRDKLERKGITATIRASRGEDILAACGLLSTKSMLEKKTIITSI